MGQFLGGCICDFTISIRGHNTGLFEVVGTVGVNLAVTPVLPARNVSEICLVVEDAHWQDNEPTRRCTTATIQSAVHDQQSTFPPLWFLLTSSGLHRSVQ